MCDLVQVLPPFDLLSGFFFVLQSGCHSFNDLRGCHFSALQQWYKLSVVEFQMREYDSINFNSFHSSMKKRNFAQKINLLPLVGGSSYTRLSSNQKGVQCHAKVSWQKCMHYPKSLIVAWRLKNM